MMPRVFVYGSLKRGRSNHRLLETSLFVSERSTKDKFTLLNLGAFPAVTEKPTCNIEGELYDVDNNTFERLDRLEGYPDFYDRKEVELDSGDKAWMYYVQPEEYENSPVVESGNW